MKIIDPSLEPYFINFEPNKGFGLYKKIKSKVRNEEASYDRDKYICICHSMESVLEKIVGLKVSDKNKDKSISLIEYLKEFRALKLEMKRIGGDDLEKRLLKIEDRISSLEINYRDNLNLINEDTFDL